MSRSEAAMEARWRASVHYAKVCTQEQTFKSEELARARFSMLYLCEGYRKLLEVRREGCVRYELVELVTFEGQALERTGA
jgi:hypothetical protein